MDATIKQYLPPQPRQGWLGRFILYALAFLAVMLLIGILGITKHHNEANASRANHSHAIAENELWGMVAGAKPPDETPLGRLATKLNGLLSTRQPVENLGNYYVNTNELDAARELLGWDFFSSFYTEGGEEHYTNKEGTFEDSFVLEAYKARFEGLHSVLRTVPPVHDKLGIWQWYWLLAAAFVWFIAVLGGCFWLMNSRQNWEEREIRRFRANLSPSQLSALDIVHDLHGRPLPKYRKQLDEKARVYHQGLLDEANGRRNKLYERARDLFRELRSGTAKSPEEVEQELARLQRDLERLDDRETATTNAGDDSDAEDGKDS